MQSELEQRNNHSVCFVPYKRHMYDLIQFLSHTQNVHVIKDKKFEITQPVSFSAHSLIFFMFGVKKIAELFGKITLAPTYILGLGKKLKSINPEIVVVFDAYHFFMLQVLSFAKHRDTKVVCYSETRKHPRGILAKIVLRFSFFLVRKVDIILVYTEEGKDYLCQYFPAEKIHVCPAPVRTQTFFPEHRRDYLEGGTLKVLVNARYDENKRHRDVFQALKNLGDEGMTNIEVTCIGRTNVGRTVVEETVAEYGLSGRVYFMEPTNSLDRLRQVYCQHDILVLSSEREAIGMVVPEAMACGTPTITSSGVGANTYVKQGTTGYIFGVGRIEELANCLKKMNEKNVLTAMGQNAHSRVVEKFSIDTIGRSMLAVLWPDGRYTSKNLDELSD